MQLLSTSSKRWAYAAWLIFIAGFAILHALHLGADFPNHTPWFSDYAKYTDEGWYGNLVRQRRHSRPPVR